jgi:hypothetical protein
MSSCTGLTSPERNVLVITIKHRPVLLVIRGFPERRHELDVDCVVDVFPQPAGTAVAHGDLHPAGVVAAWPGMVGALAAGGQGRVEPAIQLALGSCGAEPARGLWSGDGRWPGAPKAQLLAIVRPVPSKSINCKRFHSISNDFKTSRSSTAAARPGTSSEVVTGQASRGTTSRSGPRPSRQDPTARSSRAAASRPAAVEFAAKHGARCAAGRSK